MIIECKFTYNLFKDNQEMNNAAGNPEVTERGETGSDSA